MAINGDQRDLDAAARAFERAQQSVLDHYGTDATSQFVSLDDPPIQTHVLEVGDGDPVILLHGGGDVAVLMEPLLGQLGEQFRVLAPDRPGCGLTDAFDYSGVNFREHGVDFIDSLYEAFDLDRCSIVAGSIAGLWALSFGLAHPERVDRIGLVGSPVGLTADVPIPLRLMATPAVGDLLLKTVMRPSRSNTRRQFENFVVNVEEVPEELIEAAYAAETVPGARRSFKTMLQEVITLSGFKSRYVLDAELPQLDRPVMFVWGAEDDIYPPSLGESACQQLPNGRLDVVSEAGHFVWLDAPDHTAETVAEFLG